MNSRLVASARLAGMIAVEAAALAACVLVVRSVGVDWSDPVRWLNREATTIDAVMVVVGLLGIVLGVWLLGTTLLYLLAQAARLPRLAAQVRWATLPGVRRAVDAVAAGTILAAVAASHASPVAAAGRTPAAVAAQVAPVAAAGDPSGRRSPGAQGGRLETEPVEATIEGWGESLSSLAEAHLARWLGRTPLDSEVASYTVQVIDANRDRLVNRDLPDLVYRGQTFLLPVPAFADQPSPTASSEPVASGSGEVTIIIDHKGDSVWEGSKRELERQWGREPTDEEVRAYADRVIDANHDRFVEPGNPDLVFVGQEFSGPDPAADLLAPPNPAAPVEPAPSPEQPPPPTEPRKEPATAPVGEPVPPTGPVASEPAPNPASPTSASPPIAPESPVDPKEQVPPETRADGDIVLDWRVVAVAGISAVAAAVVLAELVRRRKRQLAYWRRGEELPNPPAEATVLERQLRVIADEEAAEWVDATVRGLSAVWATSPDRPRLVLVRAGRRGVEVLVNRAASPPAGLFEAGDHPNSWVLDPAVTLEELRSRAEEAPPASPALVSIGSTAEGTVLLNLEHAGTLSVTGDPARQAAFMRGLAMELGTASWARDVQVRCHAVDVDPNGLFDVKNVAELIDLVRWVHDERRNVADALDADRMMVDARIDDCSGEAWLPAVALVGCPLTPEILVAAGDNPGDGAVVVGVASDTDAGQWRLDLAADGTVLLEPLGLVMQAVGWEPDAARAANDLLVTAAAPTPPASPRAPAPSAAASVTADKFLASVLSRRPIELQILCDEPRLLGVEPDPQKLKGMAIPILVRLALADDPVSVRKLVEEIWPDQHVSMERTVRPTLSRLRTALGKDSSGRYHLPLSKAGTVGPLGEGVGFDWRRFKTLVDAESSADDDTARQYLKAALQLMQGEPFRTVRDSKYAYAGDLRREMQMIITDAAHRLADLALAADDADLAVFAVSQGRLGDAKQLELFGVEAIAHGHARRPDQVRRVREAAEHAVHTIDPTDDFPEWLSQQLDLAQRFASEPRETPAATAD